tara:strand:+ start:290 stop:784 length:495 start_codon:yes stop_codon:yes gene_type:complete
LNLVDFLLIIIISWGVYKGFLNGLVKELASILGIIFGIFLAKNYYFILDKNILLLLDVEPKLITSMSLILIFVLTIITFNIIANISTKFLQLIALNLLNKIIGSLIGGVKSILILCFLVFIISKINQIQTIENNEMKTSIVYNEIKKINTIIIENNYTEYGNEE